MDFDQGVEKLKGASRHQSRLIRMLTRLGKTSDLLFGPRSAGGVVEAHVKIVAAAQDSFQRAREGPSQDSVRFFDGR